MGDRLKPASSQPGRLVALDHLRGVVVALVVLHHAVLAYCRFDRIDHRAYLLSTAPIVDGDRWAGFDAVVLLNDSFFMPMMFLLSGLFVWPSLVRKGPSAYLRDRFRRLALPLLIGLPTIVPLAYYPSYLQAVGPIDPVGYWVQTVFSGPWPSGPFWFIEVLLAFDVATVSLAACLPRWRVAVPPWAHPRPVAGFALLVAASIAAYLPLLDVFGPYRWLSAGPFAVQASRMALYALYFAAGLVIGRHGLNAGPLALQWGGWGLLAVILAVALFCMPMARTLLPVLAWGALRGTVFVGFCASACFALSAVFLRFRQQPWPPLDSLAACSYAIFILHYPVVTWVQYGLLGLGFGAVAKGAIVSAVALGVSWSGAALLRRAPGLRRVL